MATSAKCQTAFTIRPSGFLRVIQLGRKPQARFIRHTESTAVWFPHNWCTAAVRRLGGMKGSAELDIYFYYEKNSDTNID